MLKSFSVYLSHGIFWGPPCTLTEAIFSAHKLLLRESRRDIGMVGAKALAVPAATAMRATWVQDNFLRNGQCDQNETYYSKSAPA